MSEIMKYLNELGTEITFEQQKKLDNYSKLFVEFGEKTRVETYIFNQLVGITYFINTQTQINNKLLTHPNAGFIMASESSGYKISEQVGYTDSKLTSKKVFVLDALDRPICAKLFSFDGSVITGANTTKYFYEADDSRYMFEYKSDGTCFRIIDMKYEQSGIYAKDVGDITKTDFTWVGMKYYEFADPIDPNDLTIVE